ncbi:MAG: hypothetical protein Q9M40_06540 [Sulfurimonas sp.]|nr:hypothetical protein [Sulfurimonas sp.]
MLLKSILASAFMAKYIIPMKLDEHKSHIGSFKTVLAIIDDPQNVKNDISTFAGRMQEFANIFKETSALVGVDEIELGTDSDEAARSFLKLYSDDLIKRRQKVVVTTHHKRLAALMADRDDVELMAAIYDEEARKPTYEFMQGIIGKSYAFETASRYGINNAIVKEAKAVYGDNSEKLSLLIERGSQLERELKRKHSLVDEKLADLKKKELQLKDTREEQLLEIEEQKAALKRSYDVAISEAKAAAKANDTQSIHRGDEIKANKKLPPKGEDKLQRDESFKVGDVVKYHSNRGTIISMRGEKEATIEMDGMKVRVKTKHLRHTQALNSNQKQMSL